MSASDSDDELPLAARKIKQDDNGEAKPDATPEPAAASTAALKKAAPEPVPTGTSPSLPRPSASLPKPAQKKTVGKFDDLMADLEPTVLPASKSKPATEQQKARPKQKDLFADLEPTVLSSRPAKEHKSSEHKARTGDHPRPATERSAEHRVEYPQRGKHRPPEAAEAKPPQAQNNVVPFQPAREAKPGQAPHRERAVVEKEAERPHKPLKVKPKATTEPAAEADPAHRPQQEARHPQQNGAAPASAAGPSQPKAKSVLGNGRIIESDDEDDLPLAQRLSPVQPPKKKKKRDEEAEKEREHKKKKKRDDREARSKPMPLKRKAAPDATPVRRTKAKQEAAGGEGVKWTTLQHAGVVFPPEYKPHGVYMQYDGRDVDLTPEQEEVASMYAIMLETDYVKKERFNRNFWAGFQQVLGNHHVIKGLEKCNFRPMYEHFMAEREVKKALDKEAKLELKQKKEAEEAKYKWALVDGRKEMVGNFRVEPPGLFRGRGEHPKMGMIKRRIYPRDITINIGRDATVPPVPPEYSDQRWKEVRHDGAVTWLAFWKDPISQKDFKYVWLAANSTFKSESDLAKYEKARKLKDHVEAIRKMYTRDWTSGDLRTRQMGVALYFIDVLALRAGHEKDEDEADTVGCCTLKVENVECLEEPANHIKFDFLGKDSIRYENEVEVKPEVYRLVQRFCSTYDSGKAKAPDVQLFETMNAQDLNKKLSELMDGLSVKVFRTYNASITLDSLLHKDSLSETVDEKKADYDRANKEVAILCNHQRAVPKGHGEAMQKMEAKLLQAQGELDDLEKQAKKNASDHRLRERVAKKREQLRRIQVQTRSREDLKTVALGTSKINYLDPRITIAWCKLHEVPIEKIFNKSLITKFHWAMDAEPEFRF